MNCYQIPPLKPNRFVIDMTQYQIGNVFYLYPITLGRPDPTTLCSVTRIFNAEKLEPTHGSIQNCIFPILKYF